MNTVNMETNIKSFNETYQDRRKIKNRRVSQGRRDMIRFDETGGDRRSGYARRSIDEGFREQLEEN